MFIELDQAIKLLEQALPIVERSIRGAVGLEASELRDAYERLDDLIQLLVDINL